MALASPVDSSNGGYDYQFVSAPADWLICNICQFPSKDPYLSACCGHTFCKSCLDGAKNAKHISEACPMCRSEQFSTMSNKQADRAVKNLHVFCIHKERGCKWQDELNKIAGHLASNHNGCQFQEGSCPNDCGKTIQRRYLTNHTENECSLRKVDCEYCHLSGELRFINGEHKEQCPKFPVACPNICKTDTIAREDIEEHLKECPRQEVNCSLCGMALMQKNLANHIEDECPHRQVDCQYCNIAGSQEFIEGQHIEHCPKFPLPCPNHCDVGTILRENLEVHRSECSLEMIQCEYHNVGCTTRIARNDINSHYKQKMEEHLSLTKKRLTQTENLAISVNKNLEKLEAKFQERINEIEISSEKRIHNLETVLQKRTQQIEDLLFKDKLFWTWHINTQAAKSSIDVPVASTIIKVCDISKKKRSNETHISIFFSHHKGYKFQFKATPAGLHSGKGTHISVYLLLVEGPNDELLSWPMTGEFEITLLNQISDNEHHSISNGIFNADRVTNQDEFSFGYMGWPEFISYKQLNKITPTCQFVKDDCIFFKVRTLYTPPL